MSVFRRSFYGQDPTFTNLFRLLDDFESYSREVQGSNGRQHGQRTLRFNPRFDVRETDDTYELHGELPGVAREDVSIEFTEPQTMVITGRVQRNYSSGTPPAGAVEDAPMAGVNAEAGEDNSHKATVSDEETEAAREKGESAVVSTEAPEEEKPKATQERFWHRERSVGEFQRTFTFNHRVDDSAVSANLSNGILHVSIPKAVKPEPRRITID